MIIRGFEIDMKIVDVSWVDHKRNPGSMYTGNPGCPFPPCLQACSAKPGRQLFSSYTTVCTTWTPQRSAKAREGMRGIAGQSVEALNLTLIFGSCIACRFGRNERRCCVFAAPSGLTHLQPSLSWPRTHVRHKAKMVEAQVDAQSDILHPRAVNHPACGR